jgi:Zn finger protein HypA/HybF involved in hydrogenase expression
MIIKIELKCKDCGSPVSVEDGKVEPCSICLEDAFNEGKLEDAYNEAIKEKKNGE